MILIYPENVTTQMMGNIKPDPYSLHKRGVVDYT